MRLAAVLGIALGSAACGPSTLTVRYRVPLTDNPAGAEVAQLCARRCEVTHDGDAAGLVRCIGGCPGAQVLEGRRCDESAADRPPHALCYEHERPIRRSDRVADESAGGDVFVALLGALFDVAATAIVHGTDHANEHRRDQRARSDAFEPSDPEPEPSPPSRGARETRDPPVRKPADPEPRRERTPAEPRRR